MKFTLTGKIKPYVRMTKRGKYVKKQAQEYLTSKRAIQWQVKQQMLENDFVILPDQKPAMVRMEFLHTSGFHNKDLDNQIKAVLDAMNGLAYSDDRWVDKIEACRELDTSLSYDMTTVEVLLYG